MLINFVMYWFWQLARLLLVTFYLTLSTNTPSLIYFSEEIKNTSARMEGCLLQMREPSRKNAVIRDVYI